MKIYNEKYLFDYKGMFNQSFMDYYQYVGGIMGSSGNAGKCNGCGKCLRKCPQKLDIIEELKKVKKEFEIPGYKFALVFVQKVGFPIYRFMVKLLNR
jgi:predicted aldo/keto reductase-like oxidoreductase